MAIQNDNTLLSKGDLKAYHEKILPYLGGNYMMQTGASEYYNGDEKVVGVWLDGKPLYQKTVKPNMPATIVDGTVSTIITPFTDLGIINPEMGWVTDGIVFNKDVGAISTINYAWQNEGVNSLYFLSIQFHMHFGGIYIAANRENEINNNVDVYVTVRYTKTTDTATSALTTPGAYDLNRPDLWPANKEIFFGNGLYGYRATGRATSASVTLGTFTSSLKIYSCGGYLLADSGWELQLGYGVPSSNGCGLVKNPSGNLILDVHTQYVNGSAYNIWVTYTK